MTQPGELIPNLGKLVEHLPEDFSSAPSIPEPESAIMAAGSHNGRAFRVQERHLGYVICVAKE